MAKRNGEEAIAEEIQVGWKRAKSEESKEEGSTTAEVVISFGWNIGRGPIIFGLNKGRERAGIEEEAKEEGSKAKPSLINFGRERARIEEEAKEEGSKAEPLPIDFGRIDGFYPFQYVIDFKKEEEGEASALCDGEKTKEEAASDKVKRLRGLLADCPKKLTGKDMDDVIRHLEVGEIVTLALKSGQGEYPVDPCSASAATVLAILKAMLLHIEEIPKAELWLLYKNMPYPEFAALL